MIPHLSKRSVDSQLRKWPKHDNEYLSGARRYANAGLLLFSLAFTTLDRSKGTFLLRENAQGQKSKDQGF